MRDDNPTRQQYEQQLERLLQKATESGIIKGPNFTAESGYYRAPRYDSGTGVNDFANNLGRENNRVVVTPSGNASNWANTYDYEGATYGEGSPSLIKAPVDFDTQYPMTGNDKVDYPEAYDENGYNYGGFHSLADQGLGEDNSLPSTKELRRLYNRGRNIGV